MATAYPSAHAPARLQTNVIPFPGAFERRDANRLAEECGPWVRTAYEFAQAVNDCKLDSLHDTVAGMEEGDVERALEAFSRLQKAAAYTEVIVRAAFDRLSWVYTTAPVPA